MAIQEKKECSVRKKTTMKKTKPDTGTEQRRGGNARMSCALPPNIAYADERKTGEGRGQGKTDETKGKTVEYKAVPR